jgi:hypothetical protein
MADTTYQPKVYRQQGGDRQVVASGGSLDVESGGEIDIETGGALKLAGVSVTADAGELNKLDGVTLATAALNALVQGVAGGYKVARGQATTGTASDTVVTGLATVVAVLATMDDDPVDGAMFVTASIGNQSGAPAAGSVLIKTWKCTDADSTLIAATTFSLKVNWIAIGT